MKVFVGLFSLAQLATCAYVLYRLNCCRLCSGYGVDLRWFNDWTGGRREEVLRRVCRKCGRAEEVERRPAGTLAA